MKKHVKIYATMIVLALVVSCRAAAHPPPAGRRGDAGKDKIVIGVAWPFSVTGHKLKQGVELARDEINASGGALDREIEIIWADDGASVAQGRRVAQQFADNPDVIAVIGHYNSSVSIPAAAIYEFSGILMLSPGSTNPRLTQQGYKLVFRNIPTDQEVGKQLARFAHQKSYHRMLILAAQDAYGRGLANIFEWHAGRLGLEIVDRLSYPKNSDAAYFEQILTLWQKLDFDAIFIAGTTPEAARFILQARQMGVTAPIFGGDGLDSATLWTIAGDAAEDTVVATPFHPDKSEEFKKAFDQAYHTLPDAWAAQGYDALHLLVAAIQLANSTRPAEIAVALHSLQNWPGVTGMHTFDQNGDVVGKPIVLQQVRSAKFEYLGDAQ